VRNQLASSLAWTQYSATGSTGKSGQRVPILTIVHGTQPIKNIFADNNTNQINNAIETLKYENMFLPERLFDALI